MQYCQLCKQVTDFSIYNLWGEALQILESIWLDKVWWENENLLLHIDGS